MAVTPTYWEFRIDYERRLYAWRLSALIALAALALTLGAGLWLRTRPQPIYFVAAGPGGLLAGQARADQMPPEIVERFASQVALVAGNLMPATARQSYESLRQFLLPDLQRQMASQAATDLAQIEQKRLGTSFTVNTARLQGPAENGGWTVKVQGLRRSWAGPALLAEQEVTYTFDVVRTPPSLQNPTGLAVSRIQTERPEGRGRAANG